MPGQVPTTNADAKSVQSVPVLPTAPADGDVYVYSAADGAWKPGPVTATDIADGSITTAKLDAGAVTFAKLANSAQSVITDPVAASTGNVVIDATSNPRPIYYMAPAGDQTFDPTAATVSQAVTILKTTTSAHKLTILCSGSAVAGFTVVQVGTVNTNFDLPGSATNSVTASRQWSVLIDVPNKLVYVSPPA